MGSGPPTIERRKSPKTRESFDSLYKKCKILVYGDCGDANDWEQQFVRALVTLKEDSNLFSQAINCERLDRQAIASDRKGSPQDQLKERLILQPLNLKEELRNYHASFPLVWVRALDIALTGRTSELLKKVQQYRFIEYIILPRHGFALLRQARLSPNDPLYYFRNHTVIPAMISGYRLKLDKILCQTAQARLHGSKEKLRVYVGEMNDSVELDVELTEGPCCK